MKNFTRTRKILLWLLITLIAFPVLARGRCLMPFKLPGCKPYNFTVEITPSNIPVTSSTQPTTSSQQNTTTMSNPLKQNRACYPLSRWTEMKQRANDSCERINTGVIFPNTVNAEKKLSPMVRRFVKFFELYSVEDLCEFSILMDHHDFQGVKIYPITMAKFHVYFEGERFILRKTPIQTNILVNKPNWQPNMNLAQTIMKAYPSIVLHVVISFTKGKEKTSVSSEWILTK